MTDDATYHPHVEEAHMVNALKNLVNAITSDASNLANLALTNTNLVEQLNLELDQNKVLTDLLSTNKCDVTTT